MVLGVLTVLLALRDSWPSLVDPFRFVDDARQHVFWTYRYRDPSLFAGDLYADFFSSLAPLGYHVLYGAFARLGEPLTLSRWLPLALVPATVAFAWRLGRLLEPRWGGFVAGLLLLPFVPLLRGGLPRSFALPLLVAHPSSRPSSACRSSR